MRALAMVVAASTAKSNWNDEDGIGHERERSGGGTVVGYCRRHRAAVPPPPAIQSSQFGNRVNLIWLALGIQMRPIYLYPLHFLTCYYALQSMSVCQTRHF